MTIANNKIPVYILSGFLGSGKTTFLKKWLVEGAGEETAVLVNEFGEIGLDHLILQQVNPETVLLPSGCLCCQIKGELKEALFELLKKSNQRAIPPFKQIILETTGLADPAPIVSTLLHDKMLQHHFVCAGVVTVVDAQYYGLQTTSYIEWVKQVTAADIILLSKTDCINRIEQDNAIEYLKKTNAMATIYSTQDLQSLKEKVFTHKQTKPLALLSAELTNKSVFVQSKAVNKVSNHPITQTCVLELDTAINWSAFSIWLSLLLYQYGDKILRIKGVLITEDNTSIAIHGVQRNLYQPIHIEQNELKSSKIVVITYDFDVNKIATSFYAFMKKYS